MIQYREIINLFQSIVDNHSYYRGSGHGAIQWIDAKKNQKYPLLFVRPMVSTGLTGIDGRVRTLSFELYSLEVPKIGDEDQRKLLSNTEQGIYDVFAFFTDGPVQYPIGITMVSMTPLTEAFQDAASGWVSLINIDTSGEGISYCEMA